MDKMPDVYQSCRESALRYLDYRPRSEAEVSHHLIEVKQFDPGIVERVINNLKQIRLIDDKAFAEAWVQSRTSYRPRSSLMIKHELLRKGVSIDIINSFIEIVDDKDNAFNAGLKKARLLKNVNYREFANRISAYLMRRGYSIDVVRVVVELLWENEGKKAGCE